LITNYPLLREFRQLRLSNLIKFDMVAGDSTSSSNLLGIPKNGIDGVIGAVGLSPDTTSGTSFVKTTDYTISSDTLTFIGDKSDYKACPMIYQTDFAAALSNYPLANEIVDLKLSDLIGFELIVGNTAGNTRALTGTPREGTNGVIDVVGIETSTNYHVKNCTRTTDYTVSGTTFTCVTDLSLYEALLVLYEKDLSSTANNYPLAREIQELELRNFLRMEVFAGSNKGDVTLANKPFGGAIGIIGVLAIESSANYSMKVSTGHTVSAKTLTYGEDLSSYEACVILYQYES